MLGIVIFLVGSALSGLSQNMGMLILFRGIQGLGAGALFPVALAIIGDLFTPPERGKYQGLFGAVFGIAFVLGPLIGGFLTENLQLALDLLRQHPDRHRRPVRHLAAAADGQERERATRNFDIVGGAIFTVAIGFLLVGLTNKQFGEWTDPTVGGFILVGLIGSVLFLLAESRAKEPIVPARPVAQPDLLGVDGLDLLRDLRVLRRDRLPAALVPGRRGLLADRLRAGGPAAHGRPHRQLDRVRPHRRPDRPLQVAARRARSR